MEFDQRAYMTIEQFAEYLGVCRCTAFRILEKKAMECCKLRIGKRIVVIRSVFDQIAQKFAAAGVGL